MLKIENISIKKFNPMSAEKTEWNSYHTFRKTLNEIKSPEDPISSDEKIEKTFQAIVNHPEMSLNLFTIIDNDKNFTIGFMQLGFMKENSPSYEGNKLMIQAGIDILPSSLNKELFEYIFSFISNFMSENNKKILITSSDTKKYTELLKEYGFTMALAGVENRLSLKDVNWQELEEWKKKGENNNFEANLEFYINKIPEKVIENFAKTFTETINQQPLGELSVNDIIYSPEMIRQGEQIMQQAGNKKFTAVILEKDGVVSGLTEIQFNPEKKIIATQELTGVQENYRGRGYGKWLKAHMLDWLRKEYPDIQIIRTTNASTNAPMLSINDRLGFKVHKEEQSAQIEKNLLEESIRNHK